MFHCVFPHLWTTTEFNTNKINLINPYVIQELRPVSNVKRRDRHPQRCRHSGLRRTFSPAGRLGNTPHRKYKHWKTILATEQWFFCGCVWHMWGYDDKWQYEQIMPWKYLRKACVDSRHEEPPLNRTCSQSCPSPQLPRFMCLSVDTSASRWWNKVCMCVTRKLRTKLFGFTSL